ncbi:uncharacterized protein LOC123452939 [Hordeum vulgare subsp. vulgare]|nr:uncharacterized protein LOC123452939 [Hordeum vulgare subsp. vulgare]
MSQESSFPPPHTHTNPATTMALMVAPSPLLTSGGGATAFATRLTPKKKGAGLIVSKRSRISAQLGGGGGGGDGETKPDGKKFITREQEPEQYWQTAGERKGENPMMTPLPYIVIFGFSTPFIILAIAFANGWIKTSLIR